MKLNDWLLYTFGVVDEHIRGLVYGLDPDALTFRPDPDANTIAWLCWHTGRVIDAQVMQLADREQVWDREAWAGRFGLPAGYRDTGYGHTTEQVTQIAPADPGVLADYPTNVMRAIRPVVSEMTATDFDRVIDRSYDLPVTVGVRLSSIVGDALQHIGQAAYVRGLWQRSA